VSGKSIGWAGRRWAWAGKLKMSDETSDRVFVALAVATATILSVLGNAAASQRLLDASYQAVSTTLVLLVLLRIGIFGSAIMFFAQFLLLRVPLTLDGNALYAPDAWFTLGGLLALAIAGFWMARRRSLIPDP
jgi:LPXTG-motif cell wall-anchored protein